MAFVLCDAMNSAHDLAFEAGFYKLAFVHFGAWLLGFVVSSTESAMRFPSQAADSWLLGF